MKPLMLIPPAQAEALYDAQEEGQAGDRFAPMPWLDDDNQDDDARTKAIAPKDNLGHSPLRRMQAA